MTAVPIGVCQRCGFDFYRTGQQHEHCEPCGAVIALVEVDEGGVEYKQPDGFQCACDRWSCNACGSRDDRACASCITYNLSGEIRAAAADLETATFHERDKEAFDALSRLLALGDGMARRLLLGHLRTALRSEDFRSNGSALGFEHSNGDARRERVAATPLQNEGSDKATTPLGDMLAHTSSGVEETS